MYVNVVLRKAVADEHELACAPQRVVRVPPDLYRVWVAIILLEGGADKHRPYESCAALARTALADVAVLQVLGQLLVEVIQP